MCPICLGAIAFSCVFFWMIGCCLVRVADKEVVYNGGGGRERGKGLLMDQL